MLKSFGGERMHSPCRACIPSPSVLKIVRECLVSRCTHIGWGNLWVRLSEVFPYETWILLRYAMEDNFAICVDCPGICKVVFSVEGMPSAFELLPSIDV